MVDADYLSGVIELQRRVAVMESRISQFESTILETMKHRDKATDSLKKIKLICDKIIKEKNDHFQKPWYPEMRSDGEKYDIVAGKILPIIRELESILGGKENEKVL